MKDLIETAKEINERNAISLGQTVNMSRLALKDTLNELDKMMSHADYSSNPKLKKNIDSLYKQVKKSEDFLYTDGLDEL